MKLTFTKIAFAQVLLAIVLAAAWYVKLNGVWIQAIPTPQEVQIAHSWIFQAVVFSLVWLPTVLGITGIVLAIEYVALRIYRTGKGPEQDRSAL